MNYLESDGTAMQTGDLSNNAEFQTWMRDNPDGLTELGDVATAKDLGKKTDWGMNGVGGTALGAGQLGLGVMSYLENKKTAGKQRQLMDQQISNNAFVLSTAKKRQGDISAAFGK